MTSFPLAAADPATGLVHLPHREHLIVHRAADLVECAAAQGDQLDPWDAIEQADAWRPSAVTPGTWHCCTLECATHYDAELLLTVHLYRTLWQPRWAALVLGCSGCRICPGHRARDPLTGLYQRCTDSSCFECRTPVCDCAPCPRHATPTRAHPCHPHNPRGLSFYQALWRRTQPDPAARLAAMRAAANGFVPAGARQPHLPCWPVGWSVVVTDARGGSLLTLTDQDGQAVHAERGERRLGTFAVEEPVQLGDPHLRAAVTGLIAAYCARRDAAALAVEDLDRAAARVTRAVDALSTHRIRLRSYADLAIPGVGLYVTADAGRGQQLAQLLGAWDRALLDRIAPTPFGGLCVQLRGREPVAFCGWLEQQAAASTPLRVLIADELAPPF